MYTVAAASFTLYLCFYTIFVPPPQSYYFDRDDVALPGFAKYFKKAADEEKEHAEKLMKFQVQRGGRIILNDIKKPAKDEWGSGLEAMQAALELERSVNQALLDLHKIADANQDFQVRLVIITDKQIFMTKIFLHADG